MTKRLGKIIVDDPGDGLRQLLKRVRALEPRFRRRALRLWGVFLVAEATADGVVPRKTGFLARAHVSTASDTVVEIAANTAYAAAVHERHKKRRRWLLRTIVEKARPIFEGVARKVFAEIERSPDRVTERGGFR